MSVFLKKWKQYDSSGNEMGDFLAGQMQKCNQIDILTGYFFFDGIKSIQEALEKNPELKLRILVGMDAGIDTKELVCKIYEYENSNPPHNASEAYVKQLKHFLAKFPPEQITESQAKLFNHFSAMIENDKLQIRKSKITNHSKLYIFHENNGEVSYCGGSSNFTYSGLKGRQEFNIHVMQEYAGEVKEIFDELWDNALPIIDFSDEAKSTECVPPEEIENILRKENPCSTVSPFDAYMKIMHEYLKMHESPIEIKQRIREILEHSFYTTAEGEKKQYQELAYQVDAVADAAKILQLCGGVIIADVVGLGKSVIASLLAKLSCKPGIFLVPAHLIPNWENYLTDFGLENWSVASIDNPASLESPEFVNAQMVVIDEAHNLRNPKIQIYQTLQTKLTSCDIVLLTATPFNNRPADLWSLIDLIGKFDKTELRSHFDILNEKYNVLINEIKAVYQNNLFKIPPEKQAEFDGITADIRRLVQPFIIRRNRKDLLAENSPYYAALKDLIPTQQPPINQEFKLTPKQADFYDKILNKYFAGANKEFKGAMYQPQVFISGNKNQQDGSQSQSNLYGMICRFMVSRWESSPVAFKKTLETLRDALKQYIARWDKYGIFVQIYDRSNDFADTSNDESVLDAQDDNFCDIEKVLKKITDASKKKDIYFRADKCTVDLQATGAICQEMKTDAAEKFSAALQADLDTLNKIHKELNECGVLMPENDGKLQALKSELDSILNGKYETLEKEVKTDNPRKVIVFSGFADTANYIKENLEKEPQFAGKIIFVRGQDCRNKNERKQKYEEIETHFKASGSQAASTGKMILVCTDVLSEGINLNQAGVVINYDLCYNPVRIIQRIGRINRIDKKVFDNIYNVNFFPSEKDINDMGEIAIRKMHTIHSIIREDAQVLSLDEKPLAVSADKSDKEQLTEALAATAPLSELSVIRKMYQDGLQRYNSALAAQTTYKRELDLLAGRFSMKAGDSESLYMYYHSGFSIKVVKLPDVNDPKNPQRPVSLVEALKEWSPEPTTEKLEFELSKENNRHYYALDCACDGRWGNVNSGEESKIYRACKKAGVTDSDVLNNVDLFVQNAANEEILKKLLKEQNIQEIEDMILTFVKNNQIFKIRDELFFTLGVTEKGNLK